MDDSRHVGVELLLRVLGVRDHDDRVAGMDQPCGCSVDADLAGAALSGDRVRLEAGAVVYVHYVNLLVLTDVGRVEQILVDRDRPHVVQIRPRDRGPVDLGLQHRPSHAPLPFSVVLSIRRARPTRAATASRVEPFTRSAGVKSVDERSSRYSGSIPASSSSWRAAAMTAAASTWPASTVRSAARSARDNAVALIRSSSLK